MEGQWKEQPKAGLSYVLLPEVANNKFKIVGGETKVWEP